MNFKHQYIYSKRLGCTAVAHGKTTQNRVCVRYPSKDNAYAQILIGRNNVWVNQHDYAVLREAEMKRSLKRKSADAKEVIAMADRIIAKL